VCEQVLVASLKRKAEEEKAEVESFISEGKLTLGATLQSAEEIGTAKKKALTLANSVTRILMLRRRVDEKRKLLSTVRALSSHAERVNVWVCTMLTTERAPRPPLCAGRWWVGRRRRRWWTWAPPTTTWTASPRSCNRCERRSATKKLRIEWEMSSRGHLATPAVSRVD
jgi:hypothetical protein